MKQIGTIKISGCDGEFIFDKNGVTKRKPRINKRKYREDPAYAEFTGHSTDFGRASSGGRLIKEAVFDLATEIKDAKWQSRSTKVLKECMKESLLPLGKRTVGSSNLSKLKGVMFNTHSPLTRILLVKFTTSINRETGLLSLLFPGFSPIEALNAPPGASHFQLLSAGIAIDFEKRTSISDQQYSPVLPLNNDTVNSFELSNQMPPGSDEVLLLMAGIRFYTEVNNQYYPFEDKKYKSLDIVDVNQKGW